MANILPLSTEGGAGGVPLQNPGTGNVPLNVIPFTANADPVAFSQVSNAMGGFGVGVEKAANKIYEIGIDVRDAKDTARLHSDLYNFKIGAEQITDDLLKNGNPDTYAKDFEARLTDLGRNIVKEYKGSTHSVLTLKKALDDAAAPLFVHVLHQQTALDIQTTMAITDQFAARLNEEIFAEKDPVKQGHLFEERKIVFDRAVKTRVYTPERADAELRKLDASLARAYIIEGITEFSTINNLKLLEEKFNKLSTDIKDGVVYQLNDPVKSAELSQMAQTHYYEQLRHIITNESHLDVKEEKLRKAGQESKTVKFLSAIAEFQKEKMGAVDTYDFAGQDAKEKKLKTAEDALRSTLNQAMQSQAISREQYDALVSELHKSEDDLTAKSNPKRILVIETAISGILSSELPVDYPIRETILQAHASGQINGADATKLIKRVTVAINGLKSEQFKLYAKRIKDLFVRGPFEVTPEARLMEYNQAQQWYSELVDKGKTAQDAFNEINNSPAFKHKIFTVDTSGNFSLTTRGKQEDEERDAKQKKDVRALRDTAEKLTNDTGSFLQPPTPLNTQGLDRLEHPAPKTTPPVPPKVPGISEQIFSMLSELAQKNKPAADNLYNFYNQHPNIYPDELSVLDLLSGRATPENTTDKVLAMASEKGVGDAKLQNSIKAEIARRAAPAPVPQPAPAPVALPAPTPAPQPATAPASQPATVPQPVSVPPLAIAPTAAPVPTENLSKQNSTKSAPGKVGTSPPQSASSAPTTNAPDYGPREDGTQKGRGYYGPLRYIENGNTFDVTEKSFTTSDLKDKFGNEILIPAIVPGLSKEQLDHLVHGGKITKEIADIAIKHARKRIEEGKNPFWQEGEPTTKVPGSASPAAVAPVVPSARASSSATLKYDKIIKVASEKHKVNPKLIYSMITRESGWDPNIVSEKGAEGLMQVLPKTAAEQAGKHGYKTHDLFNPSDNINLGTGYLSTLMTRYKDDMFKALAAYNWGLGNLDEMVMMLPDAHKNTHSVIYKKLPPATQRYISNIFKDMGWPTQEFKK